MEPKILQVWAKIRGRQNLHTSGVYVSRNRKEHKLFSIYSPRSWEMLRSLGTESGLQTISIGTSGEESILKTSDKETTIGEGADRTLKALKRSHISFPHTRHRLCSPGTSSVPIVEKQKRSTTSTFCSALLVAAQHSRPLVGSLARPSAAERNCSMRRRGSLTRQAARQPHVPYKTS
jgi:hypothetical protein